MFLQNAAKVSEGDERLMAARDELRRARQSTDKADAERRERERRAEAARKERERLSDDVTIKTDILKGTWIFDPPTKEYYEFDGKGNVVKVTSSKEYPRAIGKYNISGLTVFWSEDFGKGMMANSYWKY